MSSTVENSAGRSYGSDIATFYGEGIPSAVSGAINIDEPIDRAKGYSAEDYERQGNWFTDIFNPGMQAAYDKEFTMRREDSAYQRKVADLLQAGLNPILAAGGQGLESSFNVSPVPKGEGGKFFATAPEMIGVILSILNAEKDLDLKEKEISNRVQDLNIKKATENQINTVTEGQEIKNKIIEKENKDFYFDKMFKKMMNVLTFGFAYKDDFPKYTQYDYYGNPQAYGYLPYDGKN